MSIAILAQCSFSCDHLFVLGQLGEGFGCVELQVFVRVGQNPHLGEHQCECDREGFGTGHESNFALKIRNADHQLDPPHLCDRLSDVRVHHDLLQDLQTACSIKFNIRQQFQPNYRSPILHLTSSVSSRLANTSRPPASMIAT